MGLNTDSERKALAIQRSWLIAMSGQRADWQEVQERLVALGYDEAPRWLRDPELREAMDRVCRRSRDALVAGTRRNVRSKPSIMEYEHDQVRRTC